MNELWAVLIDQPKDALSTEKQAVQILRNARRPELKEGIRAHVRKIEEQRDHAVGALGIVNARPDRKVCEARRCLAEETPHEMTEQNKVPVLNLVIPARQQHIAQYEVSDQGRLVEFAKVVGKKRGADLLATTLLKKARDERRTVATRRSILPTALEGEKQAA